MSIKFASRCPQDSCQSQEQGMHCEMAPWLCLVISGPFSCTRTIFTPQATSGTGFFEVVFLFLSVWIRNLVNRTWLINPQAFKHIFTSPSSVDREPRATRSGNARIHGMKNVTVASLAYVATQVRPPLDSQASVSDTPSGAVCP